MKEKRIRVFDNLPIDSKELEDGLNDIFENKLDSDTCWHLVDLRRSLNTNRYIAVFEFETETLKRF